MQWESSFVCVEFLFEWEDFELDFELHDLLLLLLDTLDQVLVTELQFLAVPAQGGHLLC